MTSSKVLDKTIRDELCEIKNRLKQIEDQQRELRKKIDDKLDENQYRRELKELVRESSSDVLL